VDLANACHLSTLSEKNVTEHGGMSAWLCLYYFCSVGCSRLYYLNWHTILLAVFDSMHSEMPSTCTRGEGGRILHVSSNEMLAKAVRQHLYRPVTLSALVAVHIVRSEYCNTCSVLCEVRAVELETLQIERC